MATPSPMTPHPAPNGSSVPVSGGPAISRTRDWVRNGEPGSAFRGLSRGGRGGSGRGGGRGGRGGRGGGTFRGGRGTGGEPSTNKLATTPLNTDTPSATSAASKPAHPAPATEKASAPPPTTPGRPKAPSRRASRTIPTLVIAPASPSLELPPSAASARPSARRRRSQTYAKTPASAGPRIGGPPPFEENLLRPQRGRNIPVPHSAPAKDTPPHLVTSFDMRTNIDALVERVRAVAMADNRPSSPGSHIDWAGDDDDSLPDLDDWGVTTGTSAGDKDEAISPIIVDGLKPLPEPIAKSETPPLVKKEVDVDPLSATASKTERGGERENEEKEHPTTDSVETTSQMANPPVRVEKWKPRHVTHTPRTLQFNAKDDNTANHSVKSISTSSSETSFSRGSSSAQKSSKLASEPPKIPLHPSLPPKPVSAVESPMASSKMRHGATPMRIPDLERQFMTAEKAVPKPAESSIMNHVEQPEPVELPEAVKQPKPAELTVAEPAAEGPVVEEGTAHSILAPSSAEAAHKEGLFADNKPRAGLAASIHAPKTLSDSISAPSSLTSFSSMPTDPRNFHLTHNRSHTVGRPPSFPNSFPANSFNPRFSRSGASTPHGAYAHARNHSTPPAGTMSHRAHHSTRPVITGDAISRLARTIGRATDSPPRTATVASSIE